MLQHPHDQSVPALQASPARARLISSWAHLRTPKITPVPQIGVYGIRGDSATVHTLIFGGANVGFAHNEGAAVGGAGVSWQDSTAHDPGVYTYGAE